MITIRFRVLAKSGIRKSVCAAAAAVQRARAKCAATSGDFCNIRSGSGAGISDNGDTRLYRTIVFDSRGASWQIVALLICGYRRVA